MPYFHVLHVYWHLTLTVPSGPASVPVSPTVMMDITEPLVNLPYTCFGAIPGNVAWLLHDVLSQR